MLSLVQALKFNVAWIWVHNAGKGFNTKFKLIPYLKEKKKKSSIHVAARVPIKKPIAHSDNLPAQIKPGNI